MDRLKQIITSAAWCPEPEDSITVANDLVVAISLSPQRARSFLLLTLAGRAQCYPSRFLCWPLPLILILLSVSVQSFKGAESLSTSRTLWHTDITSGLTGMEWEPKTRQGAPVPCAPSLLSFSSCPQLVLKRSTTAALNSCGVCMYAYLHVCWFMLHIILLDYNASPRPSKSHFLQKLHHILTHEAKWLIYTFSLATSRGLSPICSPAAQKAALRLRSECILNRPSSPWIYTSLVSAAARPLITILPREQTGGRLGVHYSKWTLWVFFTAGSIKVIVCACLSVCVCVCAHAHVCFL